MKFSYEEFVRHVVLNNKEFPHLTTTLIAQSGMECGFGVTNLFQDHGNPWAMHYHDFLADIAKGVSYKAHDGVGIYCQFETPAAALQAYWRWFQHWTHYGDWRKAAAKTAIDWLKHIGPHYCPPGFTDAWKAEHSGLDYAEYIVNKLYAKAEGLIRKYGNSGNIFEEVTWFRLHVLGGELGVCCMDTANRARATIRGIDLRVFIEFSAQFRNARNIIPAGLNVPWPTDVGPVEPVDPKPGFDTKLMALADAEGKKAISLTDDPKCEAEKYVKNYRRELGMPSGRFAWCACFVCWCLEQVGIGIDFTPDEDKLTLAYCPTWEKWARRMSVFHAPGSVTPRRGDIILFGVDGKPAHHIGFVTEYKDGKLFCTEGNNENKTIYHVDRTSYNIRGYVRIFDTDGKLLVVPGLYEKQPTKPDPDAKTWPTDGKIPFAKQHAVKMPTRGAYQGGNASGVLLHHSASKPGTGIIDYGKSQGYAYLCLDRDGTLYQAHDIREWGYHAGDSAWKGLEGGVTDDLIGIEVVSAGRLTKVGSKLYPWWAFEDGKLARPDDDLPQSDCVYVPKTDDDEYEGWYQKITPVQEATIEKVCVWLLERCRKKILVSHYECATPKGRKNDIMGMSMTMTELRQKIRDKYGIAVTP